MDIEGGSGAEAETDFKKDTFVHPRVLQLWSLVRTHAPSLIAVIGEKPPQVTREKMAQAALLYQAVAHALLLYLLFFRHCPRVSPV